jgi:hypothetical protein
LADAGERIARVTGCLREEATAFLLANRTPYFVPLDVKIDDDSGGIVVHIRHRQVSMGDVERMVSLVRIEAFGGFGLGRKARHRWATEVFEFVEHWREDHGSAQWEECWKAFKVKTGIEELSPDWKGVWRLLRAEKLLMDERRRGKPPYKNMRSFRQAYYTERKRRERVARDAENLGD